MPLLRGRSSSKKPVSTDTGITSPSPSPAKAKAVPHKIEKILEPRIRNGITEYLVSWMGQESTSWELVETIKALGFAKLLEEFNGSLLGLKSRNNSKGNNQNAISSGTAEVRKNRIRHEPPRLPLTLPVRNRARSGFGRNLNAEKILGATDAAGEIMFLMKWYDCEEVDLVPAREANVKCPQVVITFYEGRIMGNNSIPLQELLSHPEP